MKKCYLALLLFSATISLLSCQKEGAKLFADDYSYKTTGNVIVNEDSGDTFNLAVSILGQMDIIADENNEDRVMVVRKPLIGNTVTSYATISGNKISFDPYSFIYYYSSSSLNGDMEITVTAEGEIYNENMIIITEQYTGNFDGTRSGLLDSEEDIIGTIIANDIKTVAEKNND